MKNNQVNQNNKNPEEKWVPCLSEDFCVDFGNVIPGDRKNLNEDSAPNEDMLNGFFYPDIHRLLEEDSPPDPQK